MTTFEWIAVAVTLVAVFLTARQIIWCWPTSLVSTTMYAVVFFNAQLYASMVLQTVYFGLAVYGWWAWRHGGEDDGELAVSRTRWKTGVLVLALAAVGGALLGLALDRLTDASLPYLDATLTAFSIAGQWMQTRKLLEAWLLWIAVDVLYVGMYLSQGLHPTAAMFAVFLGLAVFGFLSWKRSFEAGRAV